MAEQMTDVVLDDHEDIQITSGDFIMAESTAQHQQQLILNNKGDFKENPTICVGIHNYMDDEGVMNIARAISMEFARDGMDVKEIVLDPDGTIRSNAFYP